MSQYGYPQDGQDPQQQQQQQPEAHTAHHSKRRQYPTQQYNFSAQPPVENSYLGAPGYGGGPSPQVNPAAPGAGAAAAGANAVFTPAIAGQPNAQAAYPGAQAPVDALSNQFGGMGFGNGAAPGVAAQPAAFGGAANQTYGPGGPAYGAGYGPLGAGSGGIGAVGGAPSTYGVSGGNPTDPNAVPKLPLNKLYNLDLLSFLPPPISDLSLPPPPIILPPNAQVTQSSEANANHEYMRCTLNVVPKNRSLLKKSKLPLALVIRPYNALLNSSENIPVISDTDICRCRACRAYINPFVTFVNQGHRWKCNLCGLTNDVPAKFSYDSVNNVKKDIWARPDLNYGVVDFVAPSGYMVRPPQPPVYVFVVDVSVHSINNGLLATVARVIKENLDRLPNKDDRCKVAFIGVDSSLYFFNLEADRKEDGTVVDDDSEYMPSMLAVSDLDDPFLPIPSGLLVDLTENRKQIDSLLDKLGVLFVNNVNVNNALGSALDVAYKLIAPIGGKIICLSSSLPNVGLGKLEVREDRKSSGTSKENALLKTASSFYKDRAIEFNRSQVSVDMFLFSSHYQDVASLSNLPRFTAGQTYFYPGWNASRPEDVVKLAHELGEHLSQELAYEAVLRVRGNRNVRMSGFYGHFFNRSSDLCSFPSFPRDQSYVIEVSIEDNIVQPWISFQAAVLHSTCESERRIRVITISIPTSDLLPDIYASADQLAITAYLTQKACEKALSTGLAEARELVYNRLLEILQTYKKELMTTNVGGSAPIQFCANMRMLPLLANAIIKHVAFRQSVQIASDLRSSAICLLETLPVPYLIKYLYPDLYSLHDMPDEAGLPNEETGEIVLPQKINLTGEVIASHGLYLIHDGQTMFLWIGRDAVPQLILDAFGLDSKDKLPTGKAEIPETDVLLNQRIRAIISKLREKKDNITWPSLFIVREEGEPTLRHWASTFFVEDKTDQSSTYYQFLTGLRDKLNA